MGKLIKKLLDLLKVGAKPLLRVTFRPRAFLGRYKLIIVPAILVIVMGGSGFLYYWNNLRSHASLETTEASLGDAAGIVAEGGEIEDAIKQLERTYRVAATDEGKYLAALALADRYAQAERYDDAIKYYKEAEGRGGKDNVNVMLGIGNAAEAKNDKELAVEYYKKAVAIYKANNEGDVNSGIILYLEGKIKNMEQPDNEDS